MKPRYRGAEIALNVLMFVFLYAPLLVMVFFSFNASKSTSVFSGFSLYWYGEVFSSSDTMTALRNTLILAVLSASVATVMLWNMVPGASRLSRSSRGWL